MKIEAQEWQEEEKHRTTSDTFMRCAIAPSHLQHTIALLSL